MNTPTAPRPCGAPAASSPRGAPARQRSAHAPRSGATVSGSNTRGPTLVTPLTGPRGVSRAPVSGSSRRHPGETPRPRSARVVLSFGLVLVSASACLWPVDLLDRPLEGNRSPEIQPSAVYPGPTLFEADAACPCFRITLDVIDVDNDALRVRLAADLGRGRLARCDVEQSLGPAARAQRFSSLVVPAQLFDTTEPVHTLSVFVTDAAAFEVPVETAGDACGRIADVDPDDPARPFVVEQRWTVRLVPNLGECWGCRAP